MRYLFFVGMLVLFTQGYAQDCDRVLFQGRVVDTLQPQNFYNLMVINRTTGRGVFGQPDGGFSVYASPNDSITLSVKGYPNLGFRVKANENCQMNIYSVLQNKIYEKAEVVVRPIRSIQAIKEERASLSMRETRMVTGIEVMQSPITALYQRFSKKEQAKQWVAKMEYKDDQRKVLKELLRIYVAYDIVNLSEEEFEDFIDFLNMEETFLKTASDLELITFIKDKFDHYNRLRLNQK